MGRPFDLRSAVNRRSWAWLLDLPRRLNIVLELVDDRPFPMLPVGEGESATAIREFLRAASSPLQPAIAGAARSELPVAVSVDQYECVCFPLAPAGVLVLARELPTDQTVEDCRRDLDTIAGWLRGAIEATLTGAPRGASAEQFRMQSLQRLLNDAVAGGSIRDVVSAFAESLAVWKEVEVRGFVADAYGRFVQDVAPVGSDPFAAPAELEETAVPADEALVRLSRQDAERFGFVFAVDDVLIRRIASETGALWVMVFAGNIDVDDEAALTVYANLLSDALRTVTVAAKTRVLSSVTQHLLHFNESLEETAQLMLAEVTAALGATQGAFVATTATGIHALTAGNVDMLPAFTHRVPPDRLLIVQPGEDGGLLALVVMREGGRFTAHERELLDAVCRLLRDWVTEALERSGRGERRGAGRRVEEMIERLAAQTVEAGGQASVITMTVQETALRPGWMHAWLAKLRGRLRAWDFAGVLTASEIAVLLRDTTADQAAAVSSRLQALLESEESAGAIVRPKIGLITRSAGSGLAGSMVRAARDDAAHRLQDGIGRS
jgi:hypothetical protein